VIKEKFKIQTVQIWNEKLSILMVTMLLQGKGSKALFLKVQ
jgi:hypothetical protein